MKPKLYRDYMGPDDPDAFLGFPVRENPSKYFSNRPMVHCPVCKGHGGWNLKLKAFRDGSHFQCACNQCNGWGWVEQSSTDATCIHEFQRVTIGNCLHEETCTKCGETRVVDSSG